MMYLTALLPFILTIGPAAASSILFSNGTIIGFKKGTSDTLDSLEVTRNGDVLVTNDRIAGIFSGPAPTSNVPNGTERIDITDKIISTGFVDTHKHGWQTAFKTLGSNTTLAEYFLRYGEFATEGLLTPDDVYYGQLAGIYEALNSGVTTILDHAHHTWSNETSEAGLRASIDSGGRIFWSYAFHHIKNFSIEEQFANFRDLATKAEFEGSPTSLGIAYDNFGPNPDVEEVKTVMDLAKEFNISVVTTHALGGPWGYDNSPENLHTLGYLNNSASHGPAIIFSHASYITATSATLLRQTNQHISITPESEMHYGHGHPVSHLIQDQASLGIDTHFTYSGDILSQARLWLQATRRLLHQQVLDRWHVPSANPFSVNQAFLLATRNGGAALHRPDDIGVLAVGAKADLIVWDGTSPSMLGWRDPVSAVILHANVGDIQHVLVDGKFRKKDFKLVDKNYETVKSKFLESAARIQEAMMDPRRIVGDLEGSFMSGFEYERPLRVDVQPGGGDGYGRVFLD
ncbi:5-methylthioadenosine/S-adenosylhomocysteine deaminase [Rhypophila decipiens]|uniref:5-methylthioadenosine/S-adenosylhomocysteine deaminase n=1 Tax=Rhypophila decipiens TaxID=261697 RepID=A0AAN6Y1D2_9PEZI|nr:5-methylthioadenosine/S-adenosylhomocysteine deaminase [Rhypophila decipiens]